ncbi:M16 family metallopeptidase, partial [Cribrihabitans sp. XS_ASV171]
IVVPADGVSLEEAEAAMDDALVRFVEEGVDQAELDRIKMQLRAAQIYRRDNVDGIGNLYGRALTSGLTVEDVKEWPDIVQAVTGDDIVAAAREVLQTERSVTGWLTRKEVEATQ